MSELRESTTVYDELVLCGTVFGVVEDYLVESQNIPDGDSVIGLIEILGMLKQRLKRLEQTALKNDLRCDCFHPRKVRG